MEEEIAKDSLLDHLDRVTALLSEGPTGLLLDLDGTISEIVPGPMDAAVSPSMRGAVVDLYKRLPLVAIVTGRSSDRARDIVGIPELLYVGNHGLERLERGRLTMAEEVEPHLGFLEQLLESLRGRFSQEGLMFEPKEGSFAIHYRHTAHPERACQELLEVIEELADGRVKVVMGKQVVNVLPPVHLDKGTAVVSLVKEYGLAGVILMGDDVTDIDAFRAAEELASVGGFSKLGIAVVGSGAPQELLGLADYTLDNVAEVEGFLTWLAQQVG